VSPSSERTAAVAHATYRLARLAQEWYGVDPVRIDLVLRALNDDEDFLDALLQAGVVTAEQAHSLRHDHAPTKVLVQSPGAPIDGTPKWLLPTNGSSSGELAQIGIYRILRRLGQGGMGAVYLAFDTSENRQVAVKVLAPEHAPNQKVLRRFQLEGQHGAMLEHPNIVRSFDAGQDAATGLYYIVLEYIDGPSAHDLLDRAGKLHVGDAVHIVLDIARALEHAHKQQIIHRDIKPGNILLTSSGLAKLSDLGLAKRRDDPSNLTHASQGIGTPYYMPYEQAMNAKMADERSDIYALGATLYHLVTGEVPFGGESSLEIVEKKGIGLYVPVRERNPEAPERLDEILALTLARDPENRYQTISELIVDLERAQLSAPIPSFVNIDHALADPVVVARLTSPVERTQADMQVKKAFAEKRAKERRTWFLRFRDPRGILLKAKAPALDIIQRIRKGTIPHDAEAARSPRGPFKPLAKWPEFEKVIAALKAGAKASSRLAPTLDRGREETGSPRRHWWWLAAAALVLGVLVTLATTLGFLLLGH
jgi:serine/threonine-protein kinase